MARTIIIKDGLRHRASAVILRDSAVLAIHRIKSEREYYVLPVSQLHNCPLVPQEAGEIIQKEFER